VAARKYVFGVAARAQVQAQAKVQEEDRSSPERGRDTRPIRAADLGARTDSCDLAIAFVPDDPEAPGATVQGVYYFWETARRDD
jgi:hypothetical protein